jgi:hypothetical protein
MALVSVGEIAKKMNLKELRTAVLIDLPEEFIDLKQLLESDCKIDSEFSDITPDLAFAFTTKLKQIEDFANEISKHIIGDQAVWIAYPKGSSKRYKCEFNRDNGWVSIGKAGFEPVRQIALNEDWSALRFRRVEYIKKMTRSFAMTEEGKKRTKK